MALNLVANPNKGGGLLGALPVTSRAGEARATFGTSQPVLGSVSGNTVSFAGVSIPPGFSYQAVSVSGIRVNISAINNAPGDSFVSPSFSFSGDQIGFTYPPANYIAIVEGSAPFFHPSFDRAIPIQVNALSGGISVVGPVTNFVFAEPETDVYKVQVPTTPGGDAEEGDRYGDPMPVDSATQFHLNISGIPSGFTLYLPLSIVSTNAVGGGLAVMVAEGSTTPLLPSTAISIGGAYYQPVSSSTDLFYNVLAVDPGSIDTFRIPIAFSVAAGTTAIPSGVTFSFTIAPFASDVASGSVPTFVPLPPPAAVLIFAPTGLLITGPTIPLSSGTVGKSYGPITFAASGGTGGYTWSQTGLPASTGLTLSAGGVLTGTPTANSQGSYTLTVSVTDSSGIRTTGQFALTVNPASALLIINSALPPGTVGVTYPAVTFAATGGVGSYTWSQTGLAPNTGLALSSSGVLSGTPAPGSQGQYQLNLTVADSNGTRTSGTVSLTINLPLTTSLSLSPSSLAFKYEPGGPVPASTTFSVFGNGASAPFKVTTSVPWLTAVAKTGQTTDAVQVSVVIASLPTCAGPAACSNTTTVSVVPTNSAVTAPPPVTVTVIVSPPQPQLSISTSSESVSFVQGDSAAQRLIQVSNIGGGTLTYSASVVGNPSWLTITCGQSGLVVPSNPALVCLSVNPAALTNLGVYQAKVQISAGSQLATPVTVTAELNAAAPFIVLSPGAMMFTAVSGGLIPTGQTLNIFNKGTGALNWVAQATDSEQTQWLQLSADGCKTTLVSLAGVTNGGVAASAPSICVNSQGLAAGRYYGQISVSDSGNKAANSPQTITVLFEFLPAGTLLPEQALPTGISLSANSSAMLQTAPITLSNPNKNALSYQISCVTDNGIPWLTAGPKAGVVQGEQTTSVQAQANASLLPSGPGVYHGQIRVAFADGSTQLIRLDLEVNALSTSTAELARPFSSPPNCPGGKLEIPQFVNFGGSNDSDFSVLVGNSPLLQVTVAETGCPNTIPVTNNTDTATVEVFIDKLDGTPLEQFYMEYNATDSKWEHEWVPTLQEVGNVELYIQVKVGSSENDQAGRNSVARLAKVASPTTTQSQPAAPTMVLDAASQQADLNNLVAQGSYITIWGSFLTADNVSVSATQLPFPTNSGGVQVTLGGIPLQLPYVSSNQINALVPTAGFKMNVPLPLKLTKADGTKSLTDFKVSVHQSQPAIFLQVPPSGSTATPQGAILNATTSRIADAQYPVKANDYISIYCNGLGPLANAPNDGTPAPTNPPATTKSMPTVKIGGVPAQVVFSGLSPGSVSLYQVNAIVPAGIGPGNAVPVVVRIDDMDSNAAYIAVR